MKQLSLLDKKSKSYGGTLLKTRKGRSQPRPLTTKDSMHLVLRSSKAVDGLSFRHAGNSQKIRAIVNKFATKYSVKVISLANVGNHLHFHIKLSQRHSYRPFIRAITAAIAMAVTQTSRWKPLKKTAKDRFWDYRPFTRVIQSYRAFLNLRDYVQINQLEGLGYHRIAARFILASRRPLLESSS